MHPPVRPCSFDEAVATYNSIKPSKGRYAAYDVRPLGRRSNQHERIIKIDENNYALWPSSHWWAKPEHFDLEDARIRAAVLWERTAEGDFVHVRNDWYNGGHGTHYRFLSEVLPHGLTFVTENGKQYIIANFALVKHYLPHDKWMGGSYAKHVKNNVIAAEDEGPLTPELVYRHDKGKKFTLVSKEYPAPKKAVNLELKKALTPSIRAFKEWALIIAPMLNLKPYWVWTATEDRRFMTARDAHVAQQRTDELLLKDWAANNGYGKIYTMRNVAPKIMRQIIENDEHPMRVVLAKYVLDLCDLAHLEKEIQRGTFTEDDAQAKLNTSFNYHMNKILGLVEEK
jgi:hypothetical protein